jgi:hypothetical protein
MSYPGRDVFWEYEARHARDLLEEERRHFDAMLSKEQRYASQWMRRAFTSQIMFALALIGWLVSLVLLAK